MIECVIIIVILLIFFVLTIATDHESGSFLGGDMLNNKDSDIIIREFKNIRKGIPYKNPNGMLINHGHHGQRKLLMCEIDFMNYVSRMSRDKVGVSLTKRGGSNAPRQYIIYVGACPGMHLGIFMQKYPNVRIIAIDPSPLHVIMDDGRTHFSNPNDTLYFANDTSEVSTYSLHKNDLGRIARWYNATTGSVKMVELENPEEYSHMQTSFDNMIDNCEDEQVAQFATTLREDSAKIFYIGRLMTNKLCRFIAAVVAELRGADTSAPPVYFWSDIRSRSEDVGSARFELGVLANLAMQFTWSRMIGANYNMIKFRLPFLRKLPDTLPFDREDLHESEYKKIAEQHGNDIMYRIPQGAIRLQTRAKVTSNETRLIYAGINSDASVYSAGTPEDATMTSKAISSADTEMMSFTDYEQKMFWYNTQYRPREDIAPYDISNKELSLCNCIDCWREYEILDCTSASDYHEYSKYIDKMLGTLSHKIAIYKNEHK